MTQLGGGFFGEPGVSPVVQPLARADNTGMASGSVAVAAGVNPMAVINFGSAIFADSSYMVAGSNESAVNTDSLPFVVQSKTTSGFTVAFLGTSAGGFTFRFMAYGTQP